MHWLETYQRERGERRETDAPPLARFVQAAEADPALPLQAFVEALARLPQPLADLSDEAAAELALAVGAAAHSPRALRLLERDYFSLIPAALASMKLDPQRVDDVAQEVRQKLLVGDPPKILKYAGRGSLRGLIKVSATRAAISVLRRTQRETDPLSSREEPGEAELDPERAILKEHYRPAFRKSFELAIGQLSPRERNLLRLHFLERVTLEQLAAMYGVSRSTIVRQLAALRESIAQRTKRELGQQLTLPAGELESILDLVRSRFDVSVGGLLRTLDDTLS